MRFSVIIPVYNSQRYLEKCIKSVLHEIEKVDEIILIENGSTDDSPDICNMYAQADSRISVIKLAAAGVAAARNEGIKAAKGEWITFVDSDDMLLDGAFRPFGDIKHFGSDIIVADYSRDEGFSDNHHALKEINPDIMAKGVLQFAKYKKKLLKTVQIDDYSNWSVWAKFFRREFLLQNNIMFPERVRFSEDTAFCLQAYCAAEKIMCSRQKIYFYRPNDNSALKLKNKRLYENNKLLLIALEQIADRYPKISKWKKEFSALCAIKIIDSCFEILDTQNEEKEKEQLIRDICSTEMAKFAIKNAPVYHLINGIKNNIKYGKVLIALKTGKYYKRAKK